MSKQPARRTTKGKKPPMPVDPNVREWIVALADDLNEQRQRLSALESRLAPAEPPAPQFSPQDKSRWWSEGGDFAYCFGEAAEHPCGTYRNRSGACEPSHAAESEMASLLCRRIAEPKWWPQKAEAKPTTEQPKHCCGLTGFNPMKGDSCPACDDFNKPKPTTLREIVEAMARRMKIINDSTPREFVDEGNKQALLAVAAVCRERAKELNDHQASALIDLAKDAEQEAE